MSDLPNLASRLRAFFLDKEGATLFAGAGVAAQAGLPVWRPYLQQLAELARVHDPMTRHHMMERLEENDLLGAADLYYISRKIPQADRYQNLGLPLQRYDANALIGLAKLPFVAMVTTNFDRALHIAYARAHSDAAEEVNLDDPTLAAAPFNSRFYVARIHGRVEAPASLHLSSFHYERLSENLAYQDFLAHLFTRARLLFVGFSFLDPAIRQILDLVERKVGKYHSGRHLAVLPKGSHDEFVGYLEKFSISTLLYEPNSGHRELWDCIEGLPVAISAGVAPVATPKFADPFAVARRYLSSCYARISLGARTLPLRQAVVEGIVSANVESAAAGGIAERELCNLVAKELTLTNSDAEPLVNAALIALQNDNIVTVNQGDLGKIYKFTVSGLPSPLKSGLETLIDGATSRFVVRSSGRDTEAVRRCLKKLFQYLVSRRGWDLGASFASGEPPEQVDVAVMLRSAAECASLTGSERTGLCSAVENLLRQPNAQEANVLTELGRVSFALEIVTHSARDTLFHKATLPELVYLDANVLMPAFAPGHPYHKIYEVTINRLVQASASALSTVDIIAYRGFLNEIVSHRRLALEAMQRSGANRTAELRKEALLYGTVNMNVFVGGYANTLANEKDLTFLQYLQRNAPYKTESELARWLMDRGITVKDDAELKSGADELPDILHKLEKANSNGGWFRKEGTLILHDAVQVAALARDIRRGRRAVFVSADRRLRDNLTRQGLASLTNAITSHVGLTQLVDLLVGNVIHEKGFASMLWGSKTSNETQQIRNYLIDLALDHYHDGLAMEMGRVVDDIAEDAVLQLQEGGMRLDVNAPTQRAKVMATLDGFEERYFQHMKEAIERRRIEGESG